MAFTEQIVVINKEDQTTFNKCLVFFNQLSRTLANFMRRMLPLSQYWIILITKTFWQMKKSYYILRVRFGGSFMPCTCFCLSFISVVLVLLRSFLSVNCIVVDCVLIIALLCCCYCFFYHMLCYASYDTCYTFLLMCIFLYTLTELGINNLSISMRWG